MDKEELEALKVLKGIEFEEYDWYVETDRFRGHSGEVVENVEKAIKTIINLIEKQQKEIEFYKMQELGYIQGYEDGKSHKQTAIAIKIENAEQEFIQRKIERYKENYISKNKILKKLEEIRKQYNNILSSDNVSLEFKNINSHRFDAMSQVLEELLKGI